MKELKLACADFTFPLLQHDSVLELIAMLGCQGIDIGLFSGRSHLRPENELNDPIKNARLLKSKLNECGLGPSDCYLQLDTDLSKKAINHPDKKIRIFAREQFLRLIDYSNELGADHITCLPGMFFPDQSDEKSLDLCYGELTWRVKQVKNSSLSFSIEPHIGSPFIEPNATLELLNQVPGLTLTLDYTHFIKEGYSQNQVDHLLKFTKHFHVRGAKKGRLQTSSKNNTIDYRNIIKKMIEVDYRGWLGLEYIWVDWEKCNEVDTLSETILMRNALTRYYNELKKQVPGTGSKQLLK